MKTKLETEKKQDGLGKHLLSTGYTNHASE